jgi:hypothetical protein
MARGVEAATPARALKLPGGVTVVWEELWGKIACHWVQEQALVPESFWRCVFRTPEALLNTPRSEAVRKH